MIKLIPYILIVFTFLITNAPAFAQSKLTAIRINPLNRALILLDGSINKYKAELSPDKLTINLNIFKSSLSSLTFPIKSDGVISEITGSSQNSDFISLRIKLTDKRGYSAFYLPMSNSICIEVFDWANLSQTEDNYRSALLALEDGLYSTAKNYLIQSAGKDQPNAAAILGIIYMMEGNTNEALKYLHLSSENNSNIPDAYSALAQHYAKTGDQQKFNHYKNMYYQLSGLKSYIPILIGSLKPENISSNDSLSFLSYGLANETVVAKIDSNPAPNDTASPKTQTTQAKISNQDATLFDSIYNFVTPTLFYVAMGIVLILLMVISSYLKWRKQQISLLTKFSETVQSEAVAKKNKFKSELNQAESKSNAANQQAINKYKANENPAVANPKSKNQAPNVFADTFPENSEQVQGLARIILENQSNAQNNSNNSLLPKGFEKTKNPNLDLALSLQKKQQKLKSKNIERLTPDDIKSGDDDELSKKFGVPSSAIDAKKKISKLQSDQEELNKLAGRFKQK